MPRADRQLPIAFQRRPVRETCPGAKRPQSAMICERQRPTLRNASRKSAECGLSDSRRRAATTWAAAIVARAARPVGGPRYGTSPSVLGKTTADGRAAGRATHAGSRGPSRKTPTTKTTPKRMLAAGIHRKRREANSQRRHKARHLHKPGLCVCLGRQLELNVHVPKPRTADAGAATASMARGS